MLVQTESLTISFNILRRENDNRIEEISKLAKKVGFSGGVETDKEAREPEFTNDSFKEEFIKNLYEACNVAKFYPVTFGKYVASPARKSSHLTAAR